MNTHPNDEKPYSEDAMEWLSMFLDEYGHHGEAENVRNSFDLESYDSELRLLAFLDRMGALASVKGLQSGKIAALRTASQGECKRCDGDGVRFNNAAQEVTECGSCKPAAHASDRKVAP